MPHKKKDKLKIGFVPYHLDADEMKGCEYEIFGENETHWTLWGESEDGGNTFQFPKKVTIRTGRVIKA